MPDLRAGLPRRVLNRLVASIVIVLAIWGIATIVAVPVNVPALLCVGVAAGLVLGFVLDTGQRWVPRERSLQGTHETSVGNEGRLYALKTLSADATTPSRGRNRSTSVDLNMQKVLRDIAVHRISRKLSRTLDDAEIPAALSAHVSPTLRDHLISPTPSRLRPQQLNQFIDEIEAL